MKTISCKDMGVECDFSAQAETAEEAVKSLKEHAAQVHADKVAEMSATMSDEQMTSEMMSKVKDM
ncbi:MAG: DUF1059 domain-containing protein [Candidatus Paceibacterota bacterium]|jgi:predicted small metal-binding protein